MHRAVAERRDQPGRDRYGDYGVFLAGSAVSGPGFGATFFNAFRTVQPRAHPDRRAEVLAAIYVLNYLAFSVPAVVAGFVSTVVGLRVTALGYLKLGYLDNLSRASVAPEDVNLVVNTHLHLDHIGWNTRVVDGEWIPTFPNATYLMHKIDFEYWNPENNPNITGSQNENAFGDSIAPIDAAGPVELWEHAYTIDANLHLEEAAGHTPESSVVKFEDGTERALFAGDLFHTPLQIMYPGHNSCFDEDPGSALDTRGRPLDWAADAKALILPAHLSGRSALEIHNSDSGVAIKKWAPFNRY